MRVSPAFCALSSSGRPEKGENAHWSGADMLNEAETASGDGSHDRHYERLKILHSGANDDDAERQSRDRCWNSMAAVDRPQNVVLAHHPA